jgi:hypothetical protein
VQSSARPVPAEFETNGHPTASRGGQGTARPTRASVERQTEEQAEPGIKIWKLHSLAG